MWQIFKRPSRKATRRLVFWQPISPEAEEGQGLVEYALVLLLVAIVVISILVLLGPQIGSMYSAVSKGIS